MVIPQTGYSADQGNCVKGLKLIVDPNNRSTRKTNAYSPSSSYSSASSGNLSNRSNTISDSSSYCNVDKVRESPYLTLNGAHFEHVTELDVSNNGITSLDVISLSSLTSLTCSNNNIVTISLHGAVLKSLVVDNNSVSSIRVKSHPRQLEVFTISKNCLGSVPPWLVSCNMLQHFDVSRNNLTSLPAYITSGHLQHVKYLSASHNHLAALSTSQGIPESSLTTAERERKSSIEILLLHHNQIEDLTTTFFNNFPRLRVLNISSNKLQQIPDNPSHLLPEEECLVLQEFYAANNILKDLRPLEICQSLRILHAPFNRITAFSESLCWSCELLEEVVLSGNNISTLPSSLSRLRRLSVLKIHLNPIRSLPRLSHLDSLKVIDASHCKLGTIEFEAVVGASLSTLDIAANTSLIVDRQQFSKCRSRRSVNFVKTTSDKEQPRLENATAKEPEECYSEIDRGLTSSSSDINESQKKTYPATEYNYQLSMPWTIGFCESVGTNSELTLGQLRIPDFDESGTVGLVALADGGINSNIVKQLFSLFQKTFKEEKLSCPDLTDALKYSLLACLRKIFLTQGVFPDSFCSAYLETDAKQNESFYNRRSVRNPKSDRPQCSTLRICCYGDVTAVVTSSDGPPLVVSSSPLRRHEVTLDKRKMSSKCHIPSSIPDPQTTLVRLSHHHRSLVIASASLWEVIEPNEVNEACQNLDDPAISAKRLLTLAQSYGSRKALSILITTLPSGMYRNSHQYSSLLTKNTFGKEEQPAKSKPSQKQYLGSNDRFQSARTSFSKKNCSRHDEMEEDCHYSPSGQSDSDDLDLSEMNTNDWSSVVSNNGQEKTNQVTYYHYSPPSNLSCSCDDLRNLKQETKNASSSSLELTSELLSPPTGFGDSDADEDSDSGFSGNSNGKVINAPDEDRSSSKNAQLSSQRFQSWEFILAHNSKALFHRELDSINGKKSAFISSTSVPNLITSSLEDDPQEISLDDNVKVTTPPVSHFQRNILRKSRFTRGAVKLLQNKFSNTLKINENFNRIRTRPISNESFLFKRFGSLQNLKHYQMNKLWSNSSMNVNEIETEMTEKPSVDVLELESRMHHYWNTGVTCF